MSVIEWLPIDEMPDALKDGRPVLLWAKVCDDDWDYSAGPLAVTAHWEDLDDGDPDWRFARKDDTYYGVHVYEITNFAELNFPPSR